MRGKGRGKHSKEHIAKRVETRRARGEWSNEETNKKISESLKGHTAWNKGLKGCYADSDETRNKKSEASKLYWEKADRSKRKKPVRKPTSPETRKKMAESLKAYHARKRVEKGQ